MKAKNITLTKTILGLLMIILAATACKKETAKPPAEKLPEVLSGEAIYFQLNDISQELHKGYFGLKTANGKTYSFEFGYVDPFWVNADNVQITIDSPSILTANSVMLDTNAAKGYLSFNKVKTPNVLHLVFNARATEEDTKGVKEVHLAFTEQTKFQLSFFLEWYAPPYKNDRAFAVAEVEKTMRFFNDYSPNPGIQPAKCYAEIND